MANARKIAVRALLKIEKDGAYSNITLNGIFKDTNATKEDKALATALVYGVLDRKITLEYVLNQFLKTSISKTSPFIAQVLKTALYQIMYMEKIPDFSAVDEAVKLVKNSKEGRNAGLVNAVLRNILRQGINLPQGNTAKELSVIYSCPVPIIESFISDYGLENAEKLLKASLEAAPLTLKVNTIKTNADFVKENIGVECVSGRFPDTLILSKGIDVAGNTFYKKGYFFVQDTASQTAVSVLAPKPKERMLDMCAAPGGKSFASAIAMQNTGEIVACDIYEGRVKLIDDSVKRLGLDIVKATLNDATSFNPNLGLFDCILCDVPCSGLGIIRRKPDIKYKDFSQFDELCKVQLQILENAVKYLKPNGRILYSTCTLRRAENEGIVNSFLMKYNNLHKTYEHTFLPHIDKTDGFYCALLEF